jgi:hypothetical protein
MYTPQSSHGFNESCGYRQSLARLTLSVVFSILYSAMLITSVPSVPFEGAMNSSRRRPDGDADDEDCVLVEIVSP